MFPPAGWDTTVLVDALRSFLDTPFVVGVVAITFTTLMASKVFRFFKSIGGVEIDA